MTFSINQFLDLFVDLSIIAAHAGPLAFVSKQIYVVRLRRTWRFSAAFVSFFGATLML